MDFPHDRTTTHRPPGAVHELITAETRIETAATTRHRADRRRERDIDGLLSRAQAIKLDIERLAGQEQSPQATADILARVSGTPQTLTLDPAVSSSSASDHTIGALNRGRVRWTATTHFDIKTGSAWSTP